MSNKNKLIILGIVFTIISCGGGGGASAPVNNENLLNKPAPILNGNKNSLNDVNVVMENRAENKGNKLAENSKSTLYDIIEPEKKVSEEGEGVKLGVLDSDFLSRNKITKNYDERSYTFGEIMNNEFGDRIKIYGNNGGRLSNGKVNSNVKREWDSKDDHGIRVASIMAGKTGNGAKKSEIHAMTIKDGSKFWIDIETLKEMREKGVEIFNNSYGSIYSVEDYIKDYKEFRRAFDSYVFKLDEGLGKGIDQKIIFERRDELIKFYQKSVKEGALFIWAAGNTTNGKTHRDVTVEAGLPHFLPSLHKGWIAVVGIDKNKEDYGNHLAWAGSARNWAISAYGGCDTKGCSGYGSSFAAPKVAGLAAKIKEKYPWMTGHEIQQTILTTAEDIGQPGVDSQYGWGYINEKDALNGPMEFNNILLVGKKAREAGLKGKFKANIEDNGTYVFKNDIKGDGGLLKSGLGTLVLEGKNTYDGETVIENGTLAVRNIIMSNIKVEKNGRLILDSGASVGKERLSDDESLFDGINYGKKNVVNEGTLQSVGKGARITGDYIAKIGSKTLANLGESIFVDGDVKIEEKSSVALMASDEYFSNRKREYSVLESKGKINGNFENIDTPELLNAEMKIEDKKMLMTVNRKDTVEYVNTLENRDEMRMDTAENMEKLFSIIDENMENNGIDKELLVEVSTLQRGMDKKLIGDTLDSFSGQIHGSAQALIFKQSEIINKSLTDRMTELSNNKLKKYGIWASGIGSNGRISQRGYATGKLSLTGKQVGFDGKITENMILGTSFTHSKGNVKFNRFGGSSSSENFGISIYGKYFSKNTPYYIQGRIGYGNTKTNVEREIVISPHKKENLMSKYRNNLYSSYLETGYSYENNEISYGTFMGISYDTVNRGSFNEKRNIFGLNSKKQHYSSGSLHLGIRGEKEFNIGKNNKFKVYGQGIYRKGLNKQGLSFNAAYNGLNSSEVEVKGIGLARESIFLNLGNSLKLSNKLEIFMDYNGNRDVKRGYINTFTTGLRLEL